MVSTQTAVSQKARTAGSSRGPFAATQSAAMSPPVLSDSSRKRKRDAKGGCWGEGAGEYFITSASSTNDSAKEAGRGSFLELLLCANTSRRPTGAEERKGVEEETSRVPQEMLDVELHLGDRPMPHEWQQRLDIQSDRVHFLNTRTHARPLKDNRRSPPSTPKSIGLDAPAPVGIDLELNLSCDSSSSVSSQRGGDINVDQHKAKSKNKSTATTNKVVPAEAAAVAEAAPESSHDEMVAAVCARCHMLIMMRRTSPSCPNCKFVHPPPPEQQQHGFPGRGLVRPAAGFNQLLCCRD